MQRQLKIAVADDDRDTREYLQEYLRLLGYDVQIAADGQQFVELCLRFEPDVLVTDYAMPRLDGLAAAAEVNRQRFVPTILVSGRQDVDFQGAATGVPLVRILVKPVREADLQSAIDAAASQAATRKGTPTYVNC